MKNADMPAYPLDQESEQSIIDGYGHHWCGLTKREAFAMAAMQGILSNPNIIDTLYDEDNWIAMKAKEQADALLNELKTEKECN